MPRDCSVCAHVDRAAIDTALASQRPSRRIAIEHGIGEQAVRRHKNRHLENSPSPTGAVARRRENLNLAAELRHTRELLAEVRTQRDQLAADKAVGLERERAHMASLAAAETAQAELRRLIAQAASKPASLEATSRAVEVPRSGDGSGERAFRWLPWRRSDPAGVR